MPTKQIYVKESDLALILEAEQFGDSFSKVMMEALQDFVNKKKEQKDENGFQEITIRNGQVKPLDQSALHKFFGKRLAFLKEDNPDCQCQCEEWSRIWELYRTKKGKYLLALRDEYWGVEEDDEGRQEGPYNYEKRSYKVFENLSDISLDQPYFTPTCKALVPAELINLARDKDIWLDI